MSKQRNAKLVCCGWIYAIAIKGESGFSTCKNVSTAPEMSLTIHLDEIGQYAPRTMKSVQKNYRKPVDAHFVEVRLVDPPEAAKPKESPQCPAN